MSDSSIGCSKSSVASLIRASLPVTAAQAANPCCSAGNSRCPPTASAPRIGRAPATPPSPRLKPYASRAIRIRAKDSMTNLGPTPMNALVDRALRRGRSANRYVRMYSAWTPPRRTSRIPPRPSCRHRKSLVRWTLITSLFRRSRLRVKYITRP